MGIKISIITVAYNAEKYIEDTIKSVLSQDYDNIEYIIIDGASTDSTLEICNKYEDRISKIISEPDKGIYDAMNKGVYSASGDVIGILNADDFYTNNRVISDVVKKFEEDKPNAVYANLNYVKPDKVESIVRVWKSKPYVKGAFLKGWMPAHPTFFLEKMCYDVYGDYSLELKSAADYELMLRMIHRYGIKVSFLDKTITHMRLGGVSNASFKNRIRANKEDRMAWEMNGLKPSRLSLIKKPLSKLIQYLK